MWSDKPDGAMESQVAEKETCMRNRGYKVAWE